MVTRKIEMSDLNDAVRNFLSSVREMEIILVEENGVAQYGIIPYQIASARDRQAAWNDIEKIQQKVGEEMRKSGKTEEEFDRLLQDD